MFSTDENGNIIDSNGNVVNNVNANLFSGNLVVNGNEKEKNKTDELVSTTTKKANETTSLDNDIIQVAAKDPKNYAEFESAYNKGVAQQEQFFGFNINETNDLYTGKDNAEFQQKQAQPQQNSLDFSNDPNAMQTVQLANDLQQAIAPKYYRNTGVMAFDTKENLNLGELLFAKMLGLDVSRVDMNINANVKTRDMGKIEGEIDVMTAGVEQFADSVERYMKYDKADDYWQILRRKGTYATRGIIGAGDSENSAIAMDLLDNANHVATMRANGGKPPVHVITNAERQEQVALNDRQNFINYKARTINDALAFMNQRLYTLQSNGVPLSQKRQLQVYLGQLMADELNKSRETQEVDNRFYVAKEAFKILTKEGDAGVTKAMHLMQKNGLIGK